MELLRQSDVRSLLDFLRECYAIREFKSLDDFVRHLVAALPRLIPAAHVTYNEMYPENSRSYNSVNTTELASPKAASLWEQHMNEHPVMRHVLETDDRRAIRISDLWSQPRLRDSGLHNDFYRHYGIDDALCITVPSPAPLVIGVGWHDDRMFTERERLIADLIRPHITQAWLNAKLISAMHAQHELLKQGFESEVRGTIACDSGGGVQFMTDLAKQYLLEYFNFTPNLDQHLPERLLSWVRYEHTKLKGDDIPPVRLPLIVDKGDKRLTIRLLSNSEANLLFLEEKSLAAPDETTIKQYGLSQRESEVLLWLAQGKTNNEIAIILGMGLRTAKKHVEHILQKMGVETRTAAAALVFRPRPRND